MDIKEKGLKSSFWNWLTIMINQVRNFVVSLILARILEPEDFGVLGMAMAFTGFLEVFVDFGFGNAIIQKKNVNQKQLSTVFYLNLFVGFALTLLMFVCAPLISAYFEMEELISICRVMSVTFLVLALSNIHNALMKKRMDFKTPFYINLTSGIVTAIMGITMALLGYGVWALVCSTVIGWCITTLLLWFFNKWRPSLQFDLHSVANLWKFGYKTSLAVCIDSIYQKVDTLVIGKVFSASVLGFFYRAQSLNQLVVRYAFSSISSVLFPAFCEIKDDKEKVKHSFFSLLHVVAFLTFLFAGVLYVCSEEVIIILYTAKWIESAAILKILILFTFCYTFPTVLTAPLMSLGESGILLKIEVFKKVLLTISIPIGIYFGLYGYIYAVQIAAAIGVLINMYILRKIEIKFQETFFILLSYAVPFFILIIVFNSFCKDLDLNIFIALLLKGISLFSLYFLYCYICKLRGLVIFSNIFKVQLNKIWKTKLGK